MPAALPIFLATLAVEIISGVAFLAALQTAAIVSAIAFGVGQLFSADIPRLSIPLDQRRTFTRNAIAPRRILYGSAEFAPTPFLMETEEPVVGNLRRLVIGMVIADHEIDEIEQIYFNGSPMLLDSELAQLNAGDNLVLGTADVSNQLNSIVRNEASKTLRDNSLTSRLMKLALGKGNPNDIGFAARIEQINAEPGFAYHYHTPAGFSSWAATEMVGRNMAWLLIQLPSTPNPTIRKPFPGIPQITIRAKRSTALLAQPIGITHTNDANAAIAAYDYARNYTRYGEYFHPFGETTQDLIDCAELAASVARCDARGWEAHGVLTAADPPDVVFGSFAQAMGGGAFIDSGGKLLIQAAAPREPSLVIDQHDVLPGWTISPSLPREDRQSGISIEYHRRDPYSGKAERETQTIRNANAVAELGERIKTESAPLIASASQAADLARLALAREAESYRVSLTIGAKGLKLRPGDTCELTLPEIQLDAKLFRVLDCEINPDLSVNLTLLEDADSNYAPQTGDYYIPPLNPNRSDSEFGVCVQTADGCRDLVVGADRDRLVVYPT